MLHLRKPSAALTVSSSALVLLAAFLLLSRGLTLPAALLSAALCHELAHVLTLHALHTPPRRLTLSATGAELYVPDLHRLSYGGELLAVAAGSGCNLLLWALLSSVGGEALAPFAGAHLILGALNLLPVRPMDGGRLLWLLTALCTEPYTADRVAYAVGARCLRRPAGPVPVPDADHRRGAVSAARRPLAGRKRGLAKRRKTG